MCLAEGHKKEKIERWKGAEDKLYSFSPRRAQQNLLDVRMGFLRFLSN